MNASRGPSVLLTAGQDLRQVSADWLQKYQGTIVPVVQIASGTASVSHRLTKPIQNSLHLYYKHLDQCIIIIRSLYWTECRVALRIKLETEPSEDLANG